jgi:sec-independent protein translocase protein TatA
MGIPSGWELIVLLVVLVLLFGATKLPTAARSLGQSIRIFKAETKGTRSQEWEAPSVTPREPLPSSGPAAAGVDEPRVAEPRRHNDTIS